MDKLLMFTLNRSAKITALTERQKDKLMIKVLLTILQKYIKKENKNIQDKKWFFEKILEVFSWKNKKILSFILCTIMLLGFAAVGGEGFVQMLDAFSVKASAAEYGEYGSLNYMVENWEAQITGAARECAGDIVIPEEIDGYPVTSIKSDAFNSCDALTSVTISNGIESINEGAFFQSAVWYSFRYWHQTVNRYDR